MSRLVPGRHLCSLDSRGAESDSAPHFFLRGYFTLSVYEPSIFRLGPHPLTGNIQVGNCQGDPFTLLPEQYVGWVSMGGPPLGPDSDGCNPMLEPCVRDRVPVAPITWGNLKARD